MRIAIPTTGEAFCEHFGRADGFFLCDVDASTRSVDRPRQVVRPKARCENVPGWLKSMGVTAVIAGGVGAIARTNLASLGILVVPGQTGAEPAAIAQSYLHGQATKRDNPCEAERHESLHCRRKRAAK
jgi:predicted Fe-Mo cluster-binding NifX family protein